MGRLLTGDVLFVLMNAAAQTKLNVNKFAYGFRLHYLCGIKTLKI